MKAISFILQYFVHPKEVGAILPSSTYLGNKMIEGIDFQKAKYIVEYGSGTGVFTEKLLQNRVPDTKLLLIENNKIFYFMLKQKYINEKNIIIINGSSHNILTNTLKILDSNGAFITFQYTKLKKEFIAQFFPRIKVKREIRNMPPAYIFHCEK